MELQFFILFYIFVVSVLAEKFGFKKYQINHYFEKPNDQINREKEQKRRKRLGLAHLIHAYLIAFVLLIIIIFNEISYFKLATCSLLVFYSFCVSFIYIFRNFFITVFSLIIVIFLVYLNINYLTESINLYLNPSFYLLIALIIFPLYLEIKR